MSVQWEVTNFTIETSTSNHVSDALFANNRMQVSVIIAIRAKNPTDGNTYKLTDEELKSIQLVDYYNPDNLLPREWALSTTENEFYHVLPARLGDPEPPSAEATKAGNPSADTQKVIYWVTTTKVGNINIAVKVRQPNGIVKDTSGRDQGFDSHITLTSVAPVHYTTSNIDINKLEVASGEIEWARLPWAQYNYYITSKVYDFLKSDPHNYKGGGDPGLKYCYNYATHKPGQVSYMHYIWPMGPQETRPVGLVEKNLIANITINQMRNAQVLTLFTVSGEEGYWGASWNFWKRWFEVWDVYGNRGTFQQHWSSGQNEIIIRDYQVVMDSEADQGPVFEDAQPEA